MTSSSSKMISFSRLASLHFVLFIYLIFCLFLIFIFAYTYSMSVQQVEPLERLQNEREDTDNEIRPKAEQNQKDKTYFISFICSPKILEDPFHSKQRFSNSLWSDKQIKTIRQMHYHLEITLNQKKSINGLNNAPELKKQLTKQCPLSDENYQKELISVRNSFSMDYQTFKKSIELKKIDQQKIFDQWVKSMKSKNYIGWFIPLREEGPKLKKLVFSKVSLKMLGYEPQQFQFEFEKYRDLAIQILNGPAYKAAFIQYLTSFRKFMSHEIRGDPKYEECVKQSCILLLNQMRGKNQIVLKMQMKWSMPNPYTVCYEIIRILEQSQYQDKQLKEYRQSLNDRIERTTYQSLSRITKLPKQMNPQYSKKICSYKIIREPKVIVTYQKDSGSQSEYVLQK